MPQAPHEPPAPPRANWRQWAIVGIIVIAFALLAFLQSTRWQGVVVSAAGETLVYRTSPWLLALVAVPIMLCLALGLVIISAKHLLARVIGAAVVLLALFSAAAVLPTIVSMRLTVTPDGFTNQHGFWWSPVTNTVRFDSLAELAVVEQPTSNGPPDLVLQCRQRDGKVVRMPLGDDLKAGLNVIRLRALRQGASVPLHRIPDRNQQVARQARPSWFTRMPVFLGPLVFVGAFYWMLRKQRRQPANQMARLLQIHDVAGAIAIGEAQPPALRDFATRANLVVAYARIGRTDDARALLAELESAGSAPGATTEAQFRQIIDHLREVVAQEDPRPADVAPNPKDLPP